MKRIHPEKDTTWGEVEKPKILENEKNIVILKHLFEKFNPKNLLPRKTNTLIKKISQALSFSSTHYENNLIEMITAAAWVRPTEAVKITLQQNENVQLLLNDMYQYMPLHTDTGVIPNFEFLQETISRNNFHQFLQRNEKIGKAVKVNAHELVTHLISQHPSLTKKELLIPQLANQELEVHIVGVTTEKQPTALIFWAQNEPQKKVARKIQPRRLTQQPSFA